MAALVIHRQEGAKELLKRRGYNRISILGLDTMLKYLMAKGLIEEHQYKSSME